MNSSNETAKAADEDQEDLITSLAEFIADNPNDYEKFADVWAKALEKAHEIQAAADCNADEGKHAKGRSAYRNGRLKREYRLLGLPREVAIPRVTGKEFKPIYPQLIEREWVRDQAIKLGLSLRRRGLSYRDIASVVSEFLGVSVSYGSIAYWLRPIIEREADDFRERDLSLFRIAIAFSDALYRPDMDNGGPERVAQYVTSGIVEDSGERILLGVKVDNRESAEVYIGLFEGLMRQGMEPPAVFVGDCHSGLRKAVSVCFPTTVFVGCYFHFLKGMIESLSKRGELAKSKPGHAFVERLRRIPAKYEDYEPDTAYELAIMEIEKIIWEFQDSLPDETKTLAGRYKTLFLFLTLPIPYRKIYTNNFTERLQEYFRRREKNIACFPSRESFERHSILLLNWKAKEWAGEEVIDPEMLKEARDYVDGAYREISEVFYALDNHYWGVNHRDLDAEPCLVLWPRVVHLTVTVDQRPFNLNVLVLTGLRVRDGKACFLGALPYLDNDVEFCRVALENLLERGLDRERLLFVFTNHRYNALSQAIGEVFAGVPIQQDLDNFQARVKSKVPDAKMGEAVNMAIMEAVTASRTLGELNGRLDLIVSFLKGQNAQYRPVVELIEADRKELTVFMQWDVPDLWICATEGPSDKLLDKIKNPLEAGDGQPFDTFKELDFVFRFIDSLDQPRRGRPRNPVLRKEVLETLEARLVT